MITALQALLTNKRSGVYGIYNTINGKIYVGSAIKLHRRYVDHVYFLNLGKHHSVLLQRAWIKYGENAFEARVLEYVDDKNNLVEREQYWIDLTNSCNPSLGYNISPTAGSVLGTKHSEAAKLRRSQLLTGIVRSPETRAKMSASRKGVKIHSAEAKLKIGLAGRNRVVSEATRLKLSEAGKGRKPSAETIAKLKIAAKKRGNNHQLGLKRSPETILRMCEAQRKRHAENNQWR